MLNFGGAGEFSCETRFSAESPMSERSACHLALIGKRGTFLDFRLR
jgi:hypothetical protein